MNPKNYKIYIFYNFFEVKYIYIYIYNIPIYLKNVHVLLNDKYLNEALQESYKKELQYNIHF